MLMGWCCRCKFSYSATVQSVLNIQVHVGDCCIRVLTALLEYLNLLSKKFFRGGDVDPPLHAVAFKGLRRMLLDLRFSL